MNISATPVEAYRQNSDQLVKKESGVKKDNVNASRSQQAEKVTIPGKTTADKLSLKLEKSPSMLSQVLSSEEKDLLAKHFARFGDEVPNSQIYSTNARTKTTPQAGVRVDVKG